MTREALIAFERDVANRFNAGEIRAPVHLAGGNEDALIEVFKNIKRDDWVLSTWRSHYHCLLKGVPPVDVLREIVAGRSITLCFPKHRILTSAIVGGILPIALGLAWSIKRAGGREKVFAFIGDMTATTGIFSEVSRYANGHGLPLWFVVEDNGISVCTETVATWGGTSVGMLTIPSASRQIYKLPWPHSGAGVRVNF